MGVAAIWTLIKLARPVIDGVKEAIKSAREGAESQARHRTDTDMSIRSIAMTFAVMFAGLLGIFFAFVSVEGLPVAQTLTFALSGVLLAVVTGFLVGATPRHQQVALLLGCVVGAVVIAPVLNMLYQAYGFTGALPRADTNPDNALAAPQATLMTMIAQGIFSANLAWEYIYFGIALGVVIVVVDALLKSNTKNLCLPPLAVGIGIYLPPSLQTPLVVGAVMGYLIERSMQSRGKAEVEVGKHRGTLFASGLIVGESLIGVIIAAIIALSVSNGGSEAPLALVGDDFTGTAENLGLIVFAVMLIIFGKIVRGHNS